MVSGLQDYFNAGLGTLLLYRLERVQYREVLESEKNVQLADVYGAEHLLRLFGMSTEQCVYWTPHSGPAQRTVFSLA